MSNGNLTELERLVVDVQESGQAWVKAKLKADQLDEDAKPYLASLENEIEAQEKDSISEAKLERLAKGSQQYRGYIREMCLARGEALKKRVRYEGLQALFEAKRSEFSLEKVKIEKGIFHTGG